MLSVQILLVLTILVLQNVSTYSVHPTHYQLWLKVDDDETKSVEGKVDIQLEVTDEARNNIELNCKQLDINRNTVELIYHATDVDEEIPIDQILIYPDTEKCLIITSTAFYRGSYTLRLEWTAPIKQSGTTGLFQVNYELSGAIVP